MNLVERDLKALFIEIDHVGIAVSNLQTEIDRYKFDFGIEPSFQEVVPEQGVEVAFLTLGQGTLELLASTRADSTLHKHIQNRGPGLHHICFAVTDINQALTVLKSKGYQLIDETPRLGARQTLIAFVHPRNHGGVLLELCQKIPPQ